jgi:hypothetical protein
MRGEALGTTTTGAGKVAGVQDEIRNYNLCPCLMDGAFLLCSSFLCYINQTVGGKSEWEVKEDQAATEPAERTTNNGQTSLTVTLFVLSVES